MNNLEKSHKQKNITFPNKHTFYTSGQTANEIGEHSKISLELGLLFMLAA